MPRDGAITFCDLIGRLDHLEIVCPKCDRFGRYLVHRLAMEYGPHFKLPALSHSVPEATQNSSTRSGTVSAAAIVAAVGDLAIVNQSFIGPRGPPLPLRDPGGTPLESSIARPSR